MWNRMNRAGGATIALVLAATACSSESGQSAAIAGPQPRSITTGVTYTQVEELGNPLVQEVTIVKANHTRYDKTMPYNTAEFRPQTENFIVTVAGRPAAYASTIGGVLYPDVLVVDTSKDPATAGWLSWALANGWGGRKLSDDAVDIGLDAIFSSLLSPDGASCAPGQLPLCTDNVNGNDVPNLATFPYVAPPST